MVCLSAPGQPVKIRAQYKPSKQLGMYFSVEEDMSLADQLAVLPDREREAMLDGLDMETLAHDPEFWLRPSQLTALKSEYKLTVCLAGRGWGKTRVLSETTHKYAMENPGNTIIVLARTTSDVRDVIILGDSGIMNVTPPSERPEYKPQIRRLVWKNGSQAVLFSAERADSLRGAQAHFAVCDEIATYRNNPGSGLANAFDQVRIATRLGSHPRIVVATTPKRTPIVLDILKEAEEHPEQVLIVRGSTYANRHLSTDYQETITNLYAGTTLGAQEISGDVLTDVEGALLTQDVIDARRTMHFDATAAPDFWKTLPFRAVGVDPSVSANPNDECGIVVIGSTGEKKLYRRHAYVLEDASLLGSPEVWAKRAVEMARKYRAPVVAEANQGGEMVRMVIQGVDERVPVLLVHAGVSKFERAEPVAAAYQRGRVHHCGSNDTFAMLESQWTGWAPGQGLASPDHLDACVHACVSLIVKNPKGWLGKVQLAADMSGRVLETVRDHDPFTGYHANTVWGTTGKSAEEIRERLRVATATPDEDLEPWEDPDEKKNTQFRKARRPSQLQLPGTMGTGGARSLDNRLYRPPTRFSR